MQATVMAGWASTEGGTLRPNCPRCPRCPRCQVRLVGRSGLDWKLGRKQLPVRWVSSENSRRGHTPLRLILGREARWKRKYPSSQQIWTRPVPIWLPAGGSSANHSRSVGCWGPLTSGGRPDPHPQNPNLPFHSVLRVPPGRASVCSFPGNPISPLSPVAPGRNRGLDLHLFFSPSRLLHLSMQTLHSASNSPPTLTSHPRMDSHVAAPGAVLTPRSNLGAPTITSRPPGVESANPQASAVSTPKGQPRGPREPSDDNGRWHTLRIQRWEGGDPDGPRAALKPTRPSAVCQSASGETRQYLEGRRYLAILPDPPV